MEKAKCPHCGSEVYNTPRCSRCGKPMFEIAAETPEIRTDEDEFGFVTRAREADALQKKTTLMNVKVTDQLPDGKLPNIKTMSVQPGTFTMMVSEIHDPVLLEPGQYDVSRLGIGGSLAASFAARSAVHKVFICSVPKRPLTASFALPDRYTFDEQNDRIDDEIIDVLKITDVRQALRALSLHTAEGLPGGVRLQVELRCKSPLRLLNSLGKFKKLKSSNDGGGGGRERGLMGILSYPGEALARLILGGKSAGGERYQPFYLSDLYQHMRLELIGTLRNCFINETAKDLYDESNEARHRVSAKLTEDMAKSFDLYGLQIERVAACEFLCPDYMQLRERRGKIALDREKVSDERDESEIQRDRRALETDNYKDQVTHQEARERLALGEKALTDEMQDELDLKKDDRNRTRTAAQKQFDLEQEAKALEFQRSQEEAAARLQLRLNAEKARQDLEMDRKRLELQMEKARAVAEIANQAQNAHVDRHIKVLQAQTNQRLLFLEKYAKLPPDSVLAIALANDPSLANAYVAAVNAKSADDKLRMQKEFTEQLVKVHGQESGTVSQLMQEAVKHLGIVMAKQMESKRPQVIPGGPGTTFLRAPTTEELAKTISEDTPGPGDDDQTWLDMTGRKPNE